MALQRQGVEDFTISKFKESYEIGSRLLDIAIELLHGFEADSYITNLTRDLD